VRFGPQAGGGSLARREGIGEAVFTVCRGRQALPLQAVGVGLDHRCPSGAHADAQTGFAAPPCGKPAAFRPMPPPLSSSAQAGRLSPPACAEEILHDARPSERRSLSANQAAEPQVIDDGVEHNLDKPRACPTLDNARPNDIPQGSVRSTQVAQWKRIIRRDNGTIALALRIQVKISRVL